jgi:hypothetical protein
LFTVGPVAIGLFVAALPVVEALPVVLGMLGVPASRSRTSFLAASQHLKLLSDSPGLDADCATADPVASASSTAPANREVAFIGAPFIRSASVPT